ncbi:UDP-glycosyltransferase UGT5-like isoform X3 [Adelges cooleyi]|uniref:UDP-glycosyltransferase UGT5-like isoform X3 n=1 Tax=Adelges cooleyi TaxID=133065 RepID=UPI00217F41E5|nr:UDP-glycosyltransferase UGT5-like isoform X3 [Adelges cooleyi]
MSTSVAFTVLTVLSLFTLWWPSTCMAANVLAVQPLAARSHWTFMRAVLQTMVDSGHNVTVYTPFHSTGADNFPSGVGYTEVPLKLAMPELLGLDVLTSVRDFSDVWRFVPVGVWSSRSACDIIAGLSLTGQYDLFVVELISSECVSYLSRVLDVPLLYTFPSPMGSWMDDQVFGTNTNPSNTARLLARYGVPRTFAERLDNVHGQAVALALHWLYEQTVEHEHRKPSVMFTNSDWTVEKHEPAPVNLIRVGGLHLSTPKRLPLDILEFIENSPHGVIYFTFGSVVSMSTLPENLLNAFKEALAQVPQRVLWKYEGEMKNKPANVMTSKWFPQRDILLHPNVKLFISHGGISSVYEAVDAGVPVLGFPLFYDQPRNIANLVDAGMALSMDLFTVSKEPFLNAVLELINNQNYTINAKITSERFKDRPMTPAESVIYWTEYVLRHKGAPHLRSQALNLTWYQYYLLDVIAAILVILSVILYVIYKTLKVILQFVLKRPNKLKSKSE